MSTDSLLTFMGIALTAVLGVGAVALYAKRVSNVVTQTQEFLVAVADLLTHPNITPDMIRKVVTEAKDVPLAFRQLLSQNTPPPSVTPPASTTEQGNG
jgi:hypothetical protein